MGLQKHRDLPGGDSLKYEGETKEIGGERKREREGGQLKGRSKAGRREAPPASHLGQQILSIKSNQEPE